MKLGIVHNLTVTTWCHLGDICLSELIRRDPIRSKIHNYVQLSVKVLRLIEKMVKFTEGSD